MQRWWLFTRSLDYWNALQSLPAQRKAALLANPVFVGGLLVLAINDHYLKWQYGNWFTGKLSDLAGLLIFPLFISFLFPFCRKRAACITGTLFVFWKLPLSQPLLDAYNQVSPIQLTRVTDYTDFLAMLMLPCSHWLIQHLVKRPPATAVHRFSPWLLVLPASFVFMATSPPISYYMPPGGDIHIGKTYRLKISRAEALARLRAEGLQVRKDTSGLFPSRADAYVIENVVLEDGKDTLRSIRFSFYGDSTRPLLLLSNISLSGDGRISDWRVLKRYSRQYRKRIESEIIEDVKNPGK